MASGQYGQWYGNAPSVTDPSSQYGLAPNSTGPGGDTGGIKGSPGGNMQLIGGQQYQVYSPQWYAAMRAQNTAASGAAGTAAGTYTNAYMNAVPALAGLYGAGTSALSGVGGTGTGAGGVGGVGGATGGVGGVGPTGGPVSAGGYVSPIQMPDMSASNAAIYGAAKDQVGQQARAGLQSLNAELGAQGMLGGGAQAQEAGSVINAGQGQLGQTLRDLASKQASTALDVAKTGYEGGITQRGQDIAAQEANARLALEQRQLNMQMLNTILNGLRSAGPASAGAAGGGLQV